MGIQQILLGANIGGGISASGGTEFEPGDGYKYHVFDVSGTLVVTAGESTDASVMVLAGGGGGGTSLGGGGGSGGMLYANGTYPIVPGTYTATIGGAGAGGNPGGGSPTYNGGVGGNSEFYLPTEPAPEKGVALGGGGGGSYLYHHPGSLGTAGGCGGGTGGGYPTTPVGTGSNPGTQPANNPNPTVWTTYGFASGAGAGGGYGGAAGGGTAAIGGPGSPLPAGGALGGDAVAIPIFPGPGLGETQIPSNKWGAGGQANGYPGVTGGGTSTDSIGGTAGEPSGVNAGSNGVVNSGSGGGGGAYSAGPGFNGGSGIVIVRYSA